MIDLVSQVKADEPFPSRIDGISAGVPNLKCNETLPVWVYLSKGEGGRNNF